MPLILDLVMALSSFLNEKNSNCKFFCFLAPVESSCVILPSSCSVLHLLVALASSTKIRCLSHVTL